MSQQEKKKRKFNEMGAGPVPGYWLLGRRRPAQDHWLNKGQRTKDIELDIRPGEKEKYKKNLRIGDIELSSKGIGPSKEVAKDIIEKTPKNSIFLKKKKKNGKS